MSIKSKKGLSLQSNLLITPTKDIARMSPFMVLLLLQVLDNFRELLEDSVTNMTRDRFYTSAISCYFLKQQIRLGAKKHSFSHDPYSIRWLPNGARQRSVLKHRISSHHFTQLAHRLFAALEIGLPNSAVQLEARPQKRCLTVWEGTWKTVQHVSYPRLSLLHNHSEFVWRCAKSQ